MKYSIYINQQFCIDNDLSFQEAALLSALCESPTWAEEFVSDDAVWYWVSKSVLLKELPMLKSWDSFKKIKQKLKDKGLINYQIKGNKQLFRLTEFGKQYSRGKILPQQGEDFTPVQGEDFTPNHNTNNQDTNHIALRWDYPALIASWNELDLPNISLISSAREKALNARYKDLITVRQDLKEMPKHEAMQQLFSYVSESDFLMGRSTDFKISFDWLMKPTNFVKVMEGNYND